MAIDLDEVLTLLRATLPDSVFHDPQADELVTSARPDPPYKKPRRIVREHDGARNPPSRSRSLSYLA